MILDSGDDFVLEELMKQKKRLRQISNSLDAQHQFLRLIVQVKLLSIFNQRSHKHP